MVYASRLSIEGNSNALLLFTYAIAACRRGEKPSQSGHCRRLGVQADMRAIARFQGLLSVRNSIAGSPSLIRLGSEASGFGRAAIFPAAIVLG
ncbi:MAG: hypothetical protein ISN28_13865 [Ectothiorhodospiraceae bacterium AqS1]|nr:hypothetical protein [Ectothiorhodospiraceae bacterium AqS1]